MKNRIEIAYEFANEINSDDIIKIILYDSVARGMIRKSQTLIF